MITNCLLQCKAFAQMCNFIGLLDVFFCLSFFLSELANTRHFLMYLSNYRSRFTSTKLRRLSSVVFHVQIFPHFFNVWKKQKYLIFHFSIIAQNYIGITVNFMIWPSPSDTGWESEQKRWERTRGVNDCLGTRWEAHEDPYRAAKCGISLPFCLVGGGVFLR